ncbi:MAG: two-component system sensor histidine kinase/response regulator [Marivirga sp.]
MSKSVKNIYEQIVGGEDEFSLREIMFHKACIIIALLLNAALVITILLNFWGISLMIAITEIILALAFWLSRFMQRYILAWSIVVFTSYLLLSINFFLNGGDSGPTLILSYFSLVFLAATTKSQFQWIWAFVHSAIFSFLVLFVFYIDDSGVTPYANAELRVIDLILSYIMGTFFISLLLSMVKAAYEKQKAKVVTQHANVLTKENELKEANRDLTRVLSILAHDVRNPLASIEGYLQLNESGDLDPEMRDSLNHDLLKLVKGTSYMLDDMLHWSKGQLHGHNTNMNVLMLGPWLRPTLEHMEALAKAKNIRLTSDYLGTERVYIDPNMTTVILRNLIQNAIKFSPAKSQINLTIRLNENNFCLEVCDEGIGMEAPQIKKLFSLGSENKIGTAKEQGSGLGLILCKSYTDAQYGTITAKSTVGIGSCFELRIPQKEA